MTALFRTLQLRNEGNFEGEAANQPAIASLVGDYPEILVPERNFPTGRLNDFQRHKVRLWLEPVVESLIPSPGASRSQVRRLRSQWSGRNGVATIRVGSSPPRWSR